jgi:hypothetical protein
VSSVFAYLKMVNEADYVKVGGSFSTYSWHNHTEYLTAGTMEVKGDFIQKWYSGSSNSPGDNFKASGTHKVILSGSEKQAVSFGRPRYSNFNTLELRNYSEEGVEVSGGLSANELTQNGCRLSVTSIGHTNLKLTEDITIDSDLKIVDRTIDLNGYKLEVKGDLIQTGGTMYINGGQLEVEGDYRIENNGEFCICISEDGE